MAKKATKMSAFLSLIIIPLGAATGALAYKTSHGKQVSSVDATREADAPFRDGLYLGGLDAKDVKRAQAGVGRWSDPKDRASFVLGYQRGYQQVRGTEIAGQ